jgi:protoporphyrinogen/coproporphyrinogen III oxidase
VPPSATLEGVTSPGQTRHTGQAERAGGGARPGTLPHVVIVGGGIAGLAAAYFLRGEPVQVTVLEGSPRLGGKLAVSEVAGIAVDEGAEALLTRRPEGIGLIREVGLGDQLVTPGTTSSSVWTREAMRPLPRRQFMGVPADLDDLARSGILSADGLTRARQDLDLPATERDGDTAVAAYVGARFGAELVERLVDPLLGGVYAGRSEDLSFEATLGPLAAAARAHRSLAGAARSLLPAEPAPPPEPAQPAERSGASKRSGASARSGASEPPRPPVFASLAGGLGALPSAVAAASGAVIRTRATVRELSRTTTGWRLVVGSAAAPEEIHADAVVLAVPARPAARLLAGVAAPASAALAGIDYASMAIVTLAYPRSTFPPAQDASRSGYLVPAVDGHAVKAATFSTIKWPHLVAGGQAGQAGPGEPVHVVRCSIGRIGEEAVLQRSDEELAALAAAELAQATGTRGAPVDARVTRWGGGLPQYPVGHLDRVAAIRAGVAAQPGLAVCGAAYDGLGIPACVATARAAAGQVTSYLEASRGPAPER